MASSGSFWKSTHLIINSHWTLHWKRVMGCTDTMVCQPTIPTTRPEPRLGQVELPAEGNINNDIGGPNSTFCPGALWDWVLKSFFNNPAFTQEYLPTNNTTSTHTTIKQSTSSPLSPTTTNNWPPTPHTFTNIYNQHSPLALNKIIN